MNRITHLMPVKNGFKFLSSSLASIISNSHSEDEIIIIDDGSTDQSTIFLKTAELRVPNLRVIYTKGIGLVNALNLGINESANNWIARYDVDDSYPTYRVEKQRKQISSDTAAIFCDYRIVLNNGKKSAIIPSAIDNLATILSLPYSQQTPHPGVLLNRDIVISVGGYLLNDFPVEDLSLWLRSARYGKLVSVPEVLLNYRLSNLSTSGSRQKMAKIKKREIIAKYGLPLDVIQDNFSELGDTYFRYADSPLVEVRRILFLRNMHRFYKMHPGTTRVIAPSYCRYISLHPIQAASLVKQKSRRLLYRKINL